MTFRGHYRYSGYGYGLYTLNSDTATTTTTTADRIAVPFFPSADATNDRAIIVRALRPPSPPPQTSLLSQYVRTERSSGGPGGVVGPERIKRYRRYAHADRGSRENATCVSRTACD
ncbi:Hypothetical protein CINCED_3A020723 [Cinara cedri]|uniref:Uncharacterized protein n=1 Tax=Cinara cedri TaxID=506608 RepID=A0A5E4M2X3_9HEMI|nr:Hypothetical protein CINCED_3A020723 [Cinara cedri]